MVITSNTIFYFSGTGNSLQVAKDLKERLGDSFQLQPISKMMEYAEVEILAGCIGIIFPVYMLGLPLIVSDFIRRVRFNGKPYIFAVATCGGNVGQSFIQINRLLSKNSQQLSADFTVKMPGNNILRYDAKSEDVQQRLFMEEKVSILEISKTVAARQPVHPTTVPLLINILAPVVYKKLEKQYGSAPAFYTTEACNGCGLCQRICSVNNIQLLEKHPKWDAYCQQCMSCIQHCPQKAIQCGRKTIGRTRYQNPNVKMLSQT